MSSIKVIGGGSLKGELTIQGSKNAALPIIAATVLNKGLTILKNCPKILDVFHMIKILKELGCSAEWDENTLIIDTSKLSSAKVSESSVRKMRSSILFLGSLLGRCHEVSIAYPGGCSIGKRPIDFHLDSIKRMNVSQEFLGEDKDIIYCRTEKIVGTDIFLKFPSVGATQNIILTAVLSEGVTRIFNAAREPEVLELCNFLVEAGARICGKGTAFIEIEGVKSLRDVEFTLSPDRIVTGTYMAAVAAAGGDVILQNTPVNQLDSVIRVLSKVGCDIKTGANSLRVKCYKRPLPIEVLKTQPYPGFPTDMQSQFVSLLSVARGTSIIVETIFENRFKHVEELLRMGADIKLEGRLALIKGVKMLTGAQVVARDLRGGAALIIAALAAEGTTVISGTKHIDRGYEDIEKKLSLVGAVIRREE